MELIEEIKFRDILKAIDRWTELCETKGKDFTSMTLEEIRDFNAELNVLACNTMNNLAFLRKRIRTNDKRSR